MAKDVYRLCAFKLKPGDFEAFKAIVRPLVDDDQERAQLYGL